MSRRTRIVLVATACLLIVPIAAFASDRFTDVPDDNVFHDDITWLADAAVTLGCNPPANDEFCPKDNVTREQMSAFMRRLAENQVVDAGWLEGNTADDLTVLTASSEFESLTNVPTAVTNAGSITIEAPVDGTVIANAAGVYISFGSSTVGSLGISDSATALGQFVNTGFLDAAPTANARTRFAVSPVASFEVEAGEHTFYLNAEKSSVFDTNQLNLDNLSVTLIFVPSA